MANIYLTEGSMLCDEKVQKVFQQDKKKERILQVFFKKDDDITYEQVATIAAAGKKMSVETTQFMSRDDMLLHLGYLMGSKTKPSDSLYALFEDAEIMEFLKNYGIAEIGTPESEKKTTSRPGRKKSSKTMEDETVLSPTSKDSKEIETEPPKEKISNENHDTYDDKEKEKENRHFPIFEGNDVKVFISIMGVHPKDIEYQGTEEQLAEEIGMCMQKVELNQANFQATLMEQFGEAKGKVVYELVNPNYVFLRGSLACIKNKN